MKHLSSAVTVILIAGVMLAGCAKKTVTSDGMGEALKAQSKEAKAEPKEAKADAALELANRKSVAEEAARSADAKKQAAAQAAAQAMKDVFFDYDRSSIRDDAKSALAADAKLLGSNGSLSVIIEGHCDERGDSDYNIALGERRAKSAREYLVALGLDSSRITVISYGKEKPFCPEHDEQCWQENRSDHFVAK